MTDRPDSFSSDDLIRRAHESLDLPDSSEEGPTYEPSVPDMDAEEMVDHLDDGMPPIPKEEVRIPPTIDPRLVIQPVTSVAWRILGFFSFGFLILMWVLLIVGIADDSTDMWDTLFGAVLVSIFPLLLGMFSFRQYRKGNRR